MRAQDAGEKGESKRTNTAFILMFPSLIVSAMAIAWSPLWAAATAIALTVYQFLMLKKFIEDYYRK